MKRLFCAIMVIAVCLAGMVAVSTVFAGGRLTMGEKEILSTLQTLAADPPNRTYFLTKGAYLGGQAIQACTLPPPNPTCHMASLYEIIDPSALTYDFVNGFTTADSGQGPPAVIAGWVRTGTPASSPTTPNLAGLVNCVAWTDSTASNNGTDVSLLPIWNLGTIIAGAPLVSPWFGGTNLCSATLPVWCVCP